MSQTGDASIERERISPSAIYCQLDEHLGPGEAPYDVGAGLEHLMRWMSGEAPTHAAVPSENVPAAESARLAATTATGDAAQERDSTGNPCRPWTGTGTYSQDPWLLLGHMLERRRTELGYGFRKRAIFVRDRGAGKISVKTISRLEKGERGSYPPSTIATVEAMYQWSPGSVESVLSGGEPSPLVTARVPDSSPIIVTDSPPTAGERLASWIYVRMRNRGHDEDVIFEFLAAEGLPWEPTSMSSVKRIANATGTTVTEVLALLGIEDISAQLRADAVQRRSDMHASRMSTRL